MQQSQVKEALSIASLISFNIDVKDEKPRYSKKILTKALFEACANPSTIDEGLHFLRLIGYSLSPRKKGYPDAIDVLDTLLGLGADVHAQDEQGNTPLHLASDRFVHFLVDAGALINQQNSDGDTPLHMACKVDYSAIIRRCAQEKFSFHRSIHFAFAADIWKSLRLFLEAKALPQLKDQLQETIYARVVDFDALVREVSKYVLFLNRTYSCSRFEKKVAEELGFLGMHCQFEGKKVPVSYPFANVKKIEYLIGLGANATIKNNKGQNPLDLLLGIKRA